MRKYFFVLSLLFPFLSLAQEDIEYKEYSYTQFFQMIEDEEDSVFSLENAKIIPNLTTDQWFIVPIIRNKKAGLPQLYNPIHNSYDSIIIDKELRLNNVQFERTKVARDNGLVFLHHILFKKKVIIRDVLSISISNSRFLKDFTLFFEVSKDQIANDRLQISIIQDSEFLNGFYHGNSDIGKTEQLSAAFFLFNSKIKSGINDINFDHFNLRYQEIYFNEFSGRYMSISVGGFSEITNNSFDVDLLKINNTINQSLSLQFEENVIKGYTSLDINPNENTVVDWSQFRGKSVDGTGYLIEEVSKISELDSSNQENDFYNFTNEAYLNSYFNKSRIENNKAYKAEQRLKGKFINHYKSQNDLEFSNIAYIESKDLETLRLAYLQQENPSFRNYFTWKINQFLKVFSAYGTEPARAIIFSGYVILAFALIYLFFPNHWDSHGKNRIMDRFRFFAKYMKKDSGIHEVYLDEKREEMMAAEDFRAYMLESKQEIPGFFMATALPLYRWSVAGTKTFSWLLSKVDVLKGTWSSTEDSKKAGKSILIIGAFLIAIVYDIFIKMLNALMLSINTFTTLGFGEIPIKGLPRYLAIIQGFIGWFMLTIFSVSLISQLLN
ncbi:potassium channel family protein [Algoriphagus sp. SE2]|uniref:potassium channel family protein n=1 Tax=Algoriphagus sp. SE2 TaxID=3141536 RepID=UPI0031CD08F5